MDSLSKIAIIAVPTLISLISIIVGVGPVRALRDITGDDSLITSVLGLTVRPPRVAAGPAHASPQAATNGR